MSWRRRSKGNKKIMNATPLTFDGIKFRSRLEAFTYRKLKENGIEADYELNRYVLIPSFEYEGEKVRACTYTPDFVGKGFIIEVKGFSTDSFKIKWKMFKQYLANKRLNIDLYLPANQKKVVQVIETIKLKLNKNVTSTSKNT